MCSSGQIHKLFFLVLLLQVNLSHAEEGGWIAMPGQLEENYAGKTTDEDEGKREPDPFVDSYKKTQYLGPKADGKSSYISGEDSSNYAGESLSGNTGSNIQAMGVVGIKSYRTITNDEILAKAAGQWSSSFGVGYLIDTYDYNDSNNVYDSVYKNSSEGKNYGTLLLKFREKIGGVFYLGVNTGIGFNSGKGYFIPDGTTITTPELSNITFKLYTVPLEISLGMKFNLGKYFHINLSGAPGVMGLWQHRDDRDYQDDSKNIRQIGFGYSAEAALGINVSRMFKQFGVELLSDYHCSNFSLDFFARNQSYSNFKTADFEITGVSYGVGLTFDYL